MCKQYFLRLISVMLALVMMICMLPVVQFSVNATGAPVNLMENRNGGFEGSVVNSLVENWSLYTGNATAEVNYGISTDKANVLSGEQSAWLSKQKGQSGVGIICDMLEITGGESYYIETMVKGSGFISIYASFRDANNKEIGNTCLMDKDLDDNWRSAGGSVKAPDNAKYMGVLLYIKGDYTTMVYCDNVFACLNNEEYVCYQLQQAIQGNDRSWFESLLKSEVLGISGLRNGYGQHYFLAVKELKNITKTSVKEAIYSVHANPSAVMSRALTNVAKNLKKTVTVNALGIVEIPAETISATAALENVNLYWSGMSPNEWFAYSNNQLNLDERPDVGADNASVQLTLTMELEGAKKDVVYTATVPAYASEEEKYFALVSFNTVKGNNVNPAFVTSNLELPSKIGNKDVVWSSSKADVIRTDGTVVRPSGTSYIPVSVTAVPIDSVNEYEEVNIEDITTEVITPSDVLPFVDIARSANLSYTHEANPASRPSAVNSSYAVNGDCFLSLANPVLPHEYLFTWTEAQNANTLKLYCNYAKDQSPSDVEIYTSADGNEWKYVGGGSLPWKTSSAEYECATVPFKGNNYKALKLVVIGANTTWGAYGINKIHIYRNDVPVIGEMAATVNVLVAPSGAESGTPITVKNSDFELADKSVVANWQLLAGKIYPDGKLSPSKDSFIGRHSLKITANGGSSAATAFSDGILGIRDGYTYVASALTKGDKTLAPKLTVKFYNMYSMECGSFEKVGSASDEWQYLSVDALAPSGAVFARVLIGSASMSAGVVYADTVSFREIQLITDWSASADETVSNKIAAQPSLGYTVSYKKLNNSGKISLRFSDDKGKTLLQSDNSVVISPADAATVQVIVNNLTYFSDVVLNTVPVGTQIADNSFESLGAGNGSDWPVVDSVKTVFSDDFENSNKSWTVHPAYANTFLTEENDGTYDFMRITNNSTSTSGGPYSYAVPVKPATTYTVTFTYKTPQNPTIYCYSLSDTNVFGTSLGSSNQNIDNGTASWLTKSVNYTTAANAAYMYFMPYIQANTYMDIRSVVIKETSTSEVVENFELNRGWNYYGRPGTADSISYGKLHNNNSTNVANIKTGSASNGLRSPAIPVTAGEEYQISFGYSSHKNTSIQIEYWQESGPIGASQWKVTKLSLSGYNAFKSEPAITTIAPANAKYMTVLFYDQYYNFYLDNLIINKVVAGSNSVTQKQDGTCALTLNKTQSISSSWIPVLAGKDYSAVVTANSETVGGAKMTMTWYNLNGAVLGSKSVTSAKVNTDEFLKIDATMPIDSCNVKLTLESVDGNVIFDEANVFAVSNTVSNASFEDINAYKKSGNFPIQWRTYGSVSAHSVSDSDIKDGVLALQIKGILGGGVRSSMIRAVAGEKYFARIQASSVTGGSLNLSFFDENFRYISSGTATQFVSSDWKSYSVTAVAPEGTAYVALDMSAETGDSFTVDDAEFSTAVIDVGQNTQLLIDDYIIMSSNGFTRTFHQAQKSDVIMRDDDNVPEWERNGNYLYGTVLYDEQDGIYKMWYSGNNPGYNGGGDSRSVMACYAESADGVNWVRPNLGVWEYNGSTDNNIIGNYHIASVSINENADPSHRFQMITYTHDLYYSQFYSSNGINWEKEHVTSGGDVITASALKNGGNYGIMKWCGTTRRDFHTITFNTIDNIQTCVMSNSLADSLDAMKAYRADSYGMGLYEKDGTYIGLDWMFYITGINHMEGVIENQLAFSRDLTEEWQRPTRTPIIPLGENGSIDDGMIFTASSAIEVGDEVWMYCGAWNGDHVYSDRSCFTYIAKWRKDGFASLDATDGGTLITKPMTFTGDYLKLNANATGGSVVAELLDENGNPIAGYTRSDCDVISSDSVEHTVTWNGNGDLSNLAGQTVTLKLYATDSEVYSFGFSEEAFTPDDAVTGDVNGDGVIDILDIVKLKKYIADIYGVVPAKVMQRTDIDKNNILDAVDLAFIIKKILYRDSGKTA